MKTEKLSQNTKTGNNTNDKVGFLEENKGEYSVSRLMFTIGVSWSMIMSTLYFFMKSPSAAEMTQFVVGTVGAFIALKVGNRAFEK